MRRVRYGDSGGNTAMSRVIGVAAVTPPVRPALSECSRDLTTLSSRGHASGRAASSHAASLINQIWQPTTLDGFTACELGQINLSRHVTAVGGAFRTSQSGCS